MNSKNINVRGKKDVVVWHTVFTGCMFATHKRQYIVGMWTDQFGRYYEHGVFHGDSVSMSLQENPL